MTINQETVAHVAKLARLELTEAETTRFTQDLANILTLVEQLNELDLSELSVALQMSEPPVLRPDEGIREFSRDTMLANAPDVEDGFFRVPKILDDGAG